MCQRCVESNQNLEENRERVTELIDNARAILAGEYTEDQKRMMEEEPFPANKPFMEILFRLSSAASMLSTAHALITDEAPSIVMGQWAGLALETEIEVGIMGGLVEVMRSSFPPDMTMN